MNIILNLVLGYLAITVVYALVAPYLTIGVTHMSALRYMLTFPYHVATSLVRR